VEERKVSGQLSGAIAGSKVVVIRNATHGLTYENPTDFNAAVVEFLQAL
jgi:pimeloyl-ACP methyl ester carboxylesterase